LSRGFPIPARQALADGEERSSSTAPGQLRIDRRSEDIRLGGQLLEVLLADDPGVAAWAKWEWTQIWTELEQGDSTEVAY
jgi:hypothetical protein